MRVPNLVPIGPQAATCIRREGYTHRQTDRQTHTHTLLYRYRYADDEEWQSLKRTYLIWRMRDYRAAEYMRRAGGDEGGQCGDGRNVRDEIKARDEGRLEEEDKRRAEDGGKVNQMRR